MKLRKFSNWIFVEHCILLFLLLHANQRSLFSHQIKSIWKLWSLFGLRLPYFQCETRSYRHSKCIQVYMDLTEYAHGVGVSLYTAQAAISRGEIQKKISAAERKRTENDSALCQTIIAFYLFIFVMLLIIHNAFYVSAAHCA